MKSALVVATLLVTLPPLSRADDFALNVGAIEVVGVPSMAHTGFYPYAAISLVSPDNEIILIPSLGIEWSPESNRWGFVSALTIDFPVTSRIGVDITSVFIHDQSGQDWKNALYFLGVGPGLSVSLNRWVVSSNVCLFRALNSSDWVLVPGINLARIL